MAWQDGRFTALVADLVADGQVTGVDPDPAMRRRARTHQRPNLSFVQGRVQDLAEVCEPGSADVVVSRSAPHWLAEADLPRVFSAVHSVLRPGGWFHSESGGAGNVARIMRLTDEVASRHALGAPLTSFPDTGTALEMLERAGFAVPPGGARTVAQRRALDPRARPRGRLTPPILESWWLT